MIVLPLRIRLRRIGKKKSPSYRIVVADSRKPRGGSFLESIGHYSPGRNGTLKVDLDRVEHWMRTGAKPTNAVARLVTRARAELRPKEEPAEETEEAGGKKEGVDEGAD